MAVFNYYLPGQIAIMATTLHLAMPVSAKFRVVGQPSFGRLLVHFLKILKVVVIILFNTPNKLDIVASYH